MGTRAGYIYVDWERVDNDVKEYGDKFAQQIREEQNSNRAKKVFNQVHEIFFIRNLGFGSLIANYDKGP